MIWLDLWSSYAVDRVAVGEKIAVSLPTLKIVAIKAEMSNIFLHTLTLLCSRSNLFNINCLQDGAT